MRKSHPCEGWVGGSCSSLLLQRNTDDLGTVNCHFLSSLEDMVLKMDWDLSSLAMACLGRSDDEDSFTGGFPAVSIRPLAKQGTVLGWEGAVEPFTIGAGARIVPKWTSR